MGVQSSVFDRVVEQEKVIEQLEISASNPLHAYFYFGIAFEVSTVPNREETWEMTPFLSQGRKQQFLETR